MKKLITLLAVISLGFTAVAQEAVFLITLGSTDTIAVMETDIFKVDNEVGDSTAIVEYFYRGGIKKISADTNEAEFLVRTERLFTPSGLGYSINADNIEGITRLTATTCAFFYRKGNARIKIELAVSATVLIDAINALANN